MAGIATAFPATALIIIKIAHGTGIARFKNLFAGMGKMLRFTTASALTGIYFTAGAAVIATDK